MYKRQGDTALTLKEITPVRMMKNEFYREIEKAYNNNATKEELINLLSKGRAKKGIFEGNLVDGELEIGQISSSITQIKSVDQIFMDLINDFNNQVNDLSDIRF